MLARPSGTVPSKIGCSKHERGVTKDWGRCERGYGRTDAMLKIFGWAILIIFIIGLLVVTGILKLIF
ncbi:hypothetical protein EI613_21710 [Azospirillum sp. 412522]|nr:hypothetical protein [Azospirillum sp. 412522]MBY6264514.1 hypothetical protein [Azospirillum sp. 412522]